MNSCVGAALLPGLMRDTKCFPLVAMPIERGITFEEKLIKTFGFAATERFGQSELTLH